ncbi:MAG: hypothetical protein ABI348_04595 [Nitrososphaera sp.]
MPGRKKFRIELEDAEGSKYNLSLEGNISKDKILKIVEFMDLLNIENNEGATRNPEGEFRAPASVGDRIWALVERKFPYGSFTSSDILELYEDTYNEPIKLSIVSTYLSRYAERGRLVRNRQGKEWVYRALKPASTTAGSRAPEQQTSPSPISYDRLQ